MVPNPFQMIVTEISIYIRVKGGKLMTGMSRNQAHAYNFGLLLERQVEGHI